MRTISFAGLASLLAASHLVAQTTGSIAGIVRDGEGGSIATASVIARSPSLQGERMTSTDPDGRFRMPGLPPGTYEVSASFAGSQTVRQPGVIVPIDREAALEFRLLPSFSEEVAVLGAPPLVDVTSAAIGTIVERQTLEMLPLSRTYLQLGFLAPGVVDTPYSRGDLSIAGATAAENRFVVDGLDTTDPGFGYLISALPPEFLDVVEIKTGGYGVEYGGALGGVLNVLTRSGSNDLHAAVFGYYKDDGFGSDPPESLRNGRFLGSKSYDYGATLGGSILRDRLWFFIGWNPISERSHYVTSQGLFVTNESTKLSYIGKLSWQLHPSHQLVASAFGDPSERKSTNLVAVGILRSTFDFENRNAIASYHAIPNPDLALELSAGRYEQKTRLRPGAEQPWYRDVTGGRFARAENCGDPDLVANGMSFAPGCLGGTFVYDNLDGLRDELRLAGTWHRATGPLNHEIKAGATFRRVEFEFNVRYPAPVPGPFRDSAGTLVDAGGLTGQRWTLFPAFARLAEEEPDGPGENDEFALFLQDEISIGRWTLQAGLRAEAFDSTGAITDRDGGGRLKFGLEDMIGPRIGLVWDPVGKGRSRLFAHFARYYESVPLWINTVVFGNGRHNFYDFSYPEDGALPTAARPGLLISRRTSGDGDFSIASDLSAQHSDEYLLGFEYQLGRDVSLGLTGIYREVGDVLEDFSLDDLATTVVGNPGGTVTRHPVTGAPLEEPVTFAEPVREYRALQLTFQKRLRGHWQLAGSYVCSKNEGNYGGLLQQDIGFSSPNFTTDFDLPELGHNASGPLPNDRTHQGKLYGSYQWTFGLSTGFFARYLSGTPINKIGLDQVYAGPFRFVTPRGAAGRTPAVFTLDLRAEYPVLIRNADLTVALFADVFNVTNEQKPIFVDMMWTFAQARQTEDPNECGGPGTGPGTTCLQGNPNWGQAILFQDPRALRVGARLSW